MAMFCATPNASRAVVMTSEATNGEGGTKKSLVLRTVPFGVLTEKRPDATPVGTVVAREVALTDVKTVRLMFRPSRFSAGVVSKLNSFTVTAVPAVPIVGENPEIVGASDAPTTNGAPLVADPFGLVTPIVPVVAPPGTVTTSCVVEAEVMDADVPLKVTVF